MATKDELGDLRTAAAAAPSPAPASGAVAANYLAEVVAQILKQLGPGGYLLPAGSGLTNKLEFALNEFRKAAPAAPPDELRDALTDEQVETATQAFIDFMLPGIRVSNIDRNNYRKAVRAMFAALARGAAP